MTGLMTLAPPIARALVLERGAALVAFTVGITELGFGMQAVAAGGNRNGIPAFPFLLFGVVGVLASLGDVRMMRAGGLTGAPRLTRHLWRMSFALSIAAMSFFIGQAKVFPRPIRIMPLLALPVLAVLVTMLYWVWRVRYRRTRRALVAAGVPEAA
jgi:hypothetical protein